MATAAGMRRSHARFVLAAALIAALSVAPAVVAFTLTKGNLTQGSPDTIAISQKPGGQKKQCPRLVSDTYTRTIPPQYFLYDCTLKGRR
jgi:hypothetical protein